ncbi:MAG: site-2 protease family protein [Duodenibacillus sp.]|nr:site-2 protease family protein [Duodenibacillus sp.]
MQDILAIGANIALFAIPAILAITLHEAAHGYAARRFGDNTAWMMGRISLNPLRHIDPVGTLLVPGALLVGGLVTGATPLLFGWAKPVPVNFGRLRNPKRDMIWVALAGPGSNILQAVAWALLLQAALLAGVSGAPLEILWSLARAGINFNIMLMAFNLLPVPPLDGGRVVTGLLPWRLAARFAGIERYGMMIVALLVFSGMLNFFIRPFLMLGQGIVRLFLF